MTGQHFPQRLRVAIAARNTDRSGYSRVADAVGVHQATIYHWTTGKHFPPSYHVDKLASYLQVPKSWLLDDAPVRFWPEEIGA